MGVSQPKFLHGFSPNFQDMFTFVSVFFFLVVLCYPCVYVIIVIYIIAIIIQNKIIIRYFIVFVVLYSTLISTSCQKKSTTIIKIDVCLAY